MAGYEQDNRNPYLERVMRAASERLEGAFPGMPAVIHELDTQRLGRGLAMWGVDDGDPEKIMVGYCLPLAAAETEHLIVFQSGTICHAAALGDSVTLREHRKRFGVNRRPLVLKADSREDAETRYLQYLERHYPHSLIRNDSPDYAPLVEEGFTQAWEIATQLKAAREAARTETAQRFVQLMGGNLGVTISDPFAEEA